MTRIRTTVSVLAIPDVRRLWTAQVVSELGDWGARIALAALVYQRTGSASLTALVTALSMLPWFGLGQLLATLGDRFPRRTIMIAADLVRAALFLLVAAPVPTWLLLVAVALAGTATPAFESARAALLPEISTKKRYGDAVALSMITYQASLLAGYMLGGGLLAVTSARTALMVNAMSFLASALFIARVRGGRRVAGVERVVRGRLRSAGRALFGDTYLRRAAVLAAVCAGCGMAAEALVVVFAREIGASRGALGVLAAAVPAGSIFAAGFAPRTGDHRALLRAAAVLALFGSVAAAILFAVVRTYPLAVLPFFFTGIVFALTVPASTVVGSRLPNHLRSSAFGLLQGLTMAGQALGALAGGLIAASTGAARASSITLAAGALFALYAVLVQPRRADVVVRLDESGARHRREAPHGGNEEEDRAAV